MALNYVMHLNNPAALFAGKPLQELAWVGFKELSSKLGKFFVFHSGPKQISKFYFVFVFPAMRARELLSLFVQVFKVITGYAPRFIKSLYFGVILRATHVAPVALASKLNVVIHFRQSSLNRLHRFNKSGPRCFAGLDPYM